MAQSLKNFGSISPSPAAVDLGLGSAVMDAETALDEEKKKKLLAARMNAMSPAVLSLFGQAGGFGGIGGQS